MITGLTGNGRLLLTVNEHGDWNELFYPTRASSSTCGRHGSAFSTWEAPSSPGSAAGTAMRSSRHRMAAGTCPSLSGGVTVSPSASGTTSTRTTT